MGHLQTSQTSPSLPAAIRALGLIGVKQTSESGTFQPRSRTFPNVPNVPKTSRGQLDFGICDDIAIKEIRTSGDVSTAPSDVLPAFQNVQERPRRNTGRVGVRLEASSLATTGLAEHPPADSSIGAMREDLSMAETAPPPGNRLALAGAIWYLLEIPVLFPFLSAESPSPVKAAELVTYYSSQKTNLLIGAAGASVVLLGRIAFSAGARASLQRTAGIRALADLALGAMVLSVVLEIAMAALFAAAGRMAAVGGEQGGIVALHYAAETVGFALFPAIAVAIASTSLAQLISAQFPRWLGWLGLVAGVVGIATSAYAVATAQNLVGQSSPLLSSWIFGFWIWMVATGIVLFRRTMGRRQAQPEPPVG